MGGRFAYMLASRYPERVTRLVNVEAHPADPGVPTGDPPPYTDSYATIEDAIVEAYKRQPYADKDSLRHEIEHGLKFREDGRWTWRMDPALRNRIMARATQPRHQAGVAGACSTPVSIGIDLWRPFFGEARNSARDSARIPNCELIEIPDAAHDLPNENPAGFIRALRAYLTDTPSVTERANEDHGSGPYKLTAGANKYQNLLICLPFVLKPIQ